MIVIPNLFSAYQKGREAAIEANWNDLKNYENIEAMRTRNDRDALQLLAEQADYNINRSMMQDNGDVSALNAALANERFYSDVYNARNNALLGQAQYVAATNAAADGRLQGYANGQLTTTFRNGDTNLFNSGVNNFDAAARYDALMNNGSDYRQLVSDTVADNIAAGRQAIVTNQATRPYNHTATVNDAQITAEQYRQASVYQQGRGADLGAIYNTGKNTAQAGLTASQTSMIDNENLLTKAKSFPKEERKALLAQLLNQRTLLLQNMQLAAQSGNNAAVQAMASQYGTIDADIVRLGGQSQLHLVREAVAGAMGAVPPSAATTQVSPTPATKTPTQVSPTPATKTPTQVPQQLLAGQPQPSFTPNGMDPRNAALANLSINRAPVNPKQRVGAGGLTNEDWDRLAQNAGVGYTGGYW